MYEIIPYLKHNNELTGQVARIDLNFTQLPLLYLKSQDLNCETKCII